MTSVRLRAISPLLVVSALLLTQAPAAGKETGRRDGRRLFTPVVKISAHETKKMLHTGVKVAAELARVSPYTSGLIVGSEAVIMAGDMAAAGIDAGTDIVQHRLVIVISRNKRVLETLKKEGRLKRGNREFDTIMAELENERRAMSFKSGGDFFMRAVTSKEGLHAMSKIPLKHGIGAVLGDGVSRWLGLGGGLRKLSMGRLARSRDATRPTWERADGISRFMGQVIDQLNKLTVKEAVKMEGSEELLPDIPGLSDNDLSTPTEPRPYLPMPERSLLVAPPTALTLSPASAAPGRAAPVQAGPIIAPARATARGVAPTDSIPPPIPVLPPSEVTGGVHEPRPEPDDSRSRPRGGLEVEDSPARRQAERILRTENWPKP
jgi:hypothetical protein